MQVVIKGSVCFGCGVSIGKEILLLSPEEMYEAISLAFKHSNDYLLGLANQGYEGPFRDYSTIEFEEYLRLCEIFEKEMALAEQTRKTKKTLTKLRRTEFGRNRAQLMLAMIEDGIQYACSFAGCMESENLTIDHIMPLSRGGTDEITNLQFMCRLHNSTKGDRKHELL